MSEDRLEEALEAMRNEAIDTDQLRQAGSRVREKLGGPACVCSEFRPELVDYLGGRLARNRMLLLEDHLGRCAACRAQLAGLRGEQKTVPFRASRRILLPAWSKWAAAAAILVALVYTSRGTLDRMLAPGGPRATVASLTGGLYLVPAGRLMPGSTIDEGAVIRSGPGSRAVLRLADGSLIDVNEHTELSVHAAWSGQSIDLQRGDIILKAAKQRRGYLRVHTRDSVASVRGTIFAVSAGLSGSVVSVVEGSVGVVQPGTDTVLKPGQQAATNPALARSVQTAVGWSPDAESYLDILGSLAAVEKQLAELPMPSLHTRSTLLGFVPASMIVYGAVPNISGTVDEALSLAERQSAENPAFQQWWNSGPGAGLKQLMGHLQTVTPLLGEEIVYGICAKDGGTRQLVPVLLAEVPHGKRAELEAALNGIGGLRQAPAFYLTEGLLAVSSSGQNLEWLLDNVGKGTETPFTTEIAARYSHGAAWLLGIDMESIISANHSKGAEIVQAQHLKHLFVEQRSVQGEEENEIAVSFGGPRAGIASFLANSGSGGAAEYISSDTVAAFYGSTREPYQMIEEVFRLLARSDPEFLGRLARSEAELGFSLRDDVAASFGTESAFGIQGFTTAGPVWMSATLVHNPAGINQLARRVVAMSNARIADAGVNQRIVFSEEVADGRSWSKITSTAAPIAITWTYDRGYMVAGSDRGVVLKAIATRNGGTPLVWSQEFRKQLPASTALHPSGFGWLNTRGAFNGLEGFVSNPALQKIMADRDPVLLVFSGTTEQIRAVSRTRISSLLMNSMLLQTVSSSGREERRRFANGGDGR